MSFVLPSISRLRDTITHRSLGLNQNCCPLPRRLACRHHLTEKEAAPTATFSTPWQLQLPCLAAASLQASFSDETVEHKIAKTPRLCSPTLSTQQTTVLKHSPYPTDGAGLSGSCFLQAAAIPSSDHGASSGLRKKGRPCSAPQVHCVCFADPSARRQPLGCLLRLITSLSVPCAGNATEFCLIKLFLSLPPLIYQA